MNNKTASILLVCIIAIAAILRLIHPFQIPYTYDELSALSRTHFNSFSELIDKGIIIDGHPAGVQVFLYYWTKLFGYNELIVKLPFIVLGILSVYFIFKIGQAWFNSTVGLVCAAYLATLEYPIMFSQTVRPYSSGLFLCLAMVYYWHNVIFNATEKPNRNLILYIFFSACCAYNHHFSLLFAGIVGITGLFFVQKKQIGKYIIAGVAIFVLYIPHLRIFFYQLHHGGIGGADGWLGKPKYTFASDYLSYVFNFSHTVASVAILIILYSIYSAIKNRGIKNIRFMLISFVWFLAPLVIGVLYSILINPVLQYSMLLFSFPFLLLFIFSVVPELPLKIALPLLTLICTINIFSLVHTRQYYRLAYKAPYEQPIVVNDSLVKALGKDNYAAILQTEDSDKYITDYYIQKDHADTSFRMAHSLGCFIANTSSYLKLIHFVTEQKKQYFAFGCTASFDPSILQIISSKYPYMVKKWDFYDASFFLFSDKPLPSITKQYSFESKNDFEGAVKFWSQADTSCTNDTIHFSGRHAYKMDEKHEWAPAFSCNLNDMSWNKNDIIDISLEVYPIDTLNEVSIVSAIESNGNTIQWNETNINKFIPDSLKRTWVKVYHALKLQDIHITVPNPVLKVYIWNKGKKKFYMDDFEVKTFKGNPIIYGLIQKI